MKTMSLVLLPTQEGPLTPADAGLCVNAEFFLLLRFFLVYMGVCGCVCLCGGQMSTLSVLSQDSQARLHREILC